MTNLAASDITVTVLKNSKLEDNRKDLILTLAFGDGAKTYPVGGVPVTGAFLGCPNNVDLVNIFDTGVSAYVWSYDRVNKKLVAVQQAAQTATAAAQVITVNSHTHAFTPAGTNANDGPPETFTGTPGTTGGTVATATAATSSVPVAAHGLAEPSAVAIVAQTLKVRVIGY